MVQKQSQIDLMREVNPYGSFQKMESYSTFAEFDGSTFTSQPFPLIQLVTSFKLKSNYGIVGFQFQTSILNTEEPSAGILISIGIPRPTTNITLETGKNQRILATHSSRQNSSDMNANTRGNTENTFLMLGDLYGFNLATQETVNIYSWGSGSSTDLYSVFANIYLAPSKRTVGQLPPKSTKM